jgi:hypothetical protein
MTVRAVDQREIQRMGGRRAKYPTAAVVDMLLRPLKPYCVLETTYGEGRFYAVFRPPYLIGADVERLEWVVRPDEFHQMPVWALYHRLRSGSLGLGRRPDAVVCDPPWGYWQRRLHYWRRGAWGSPRLILEYSLKVAELVGARLFLLHWGEEPPALPGWRLDAVVVFRPFTRYLNAGEARTFFALYSLSK